MMLYYSQHSWLLAILHCLSFSHPALEYWNMILTLWATSLPGMSFVFLELFLAINSYNCMILDKVYKILSLSVYCNCIEGFLKDFLV